MKNRYCTDCKKPSASMCEACKKNRCRLRALHLAFERAGCEADRIGRAERVDEYHNRFVSGRPIFDER